MSETTVKIVNVMDGEEVANAIGLFVNSYTNPSKAFHECMLEKDANCQHNFTVLCFDWFKVLSKTECFDDRNKASVEYAKIIANGIGTEELHKRIQKSRYIKCECIFDYRDDESAVELFSNYLRNSDNNNSFILCMLRVHRTNQQSFSRMCCEWFRYLAEHSIQQNRYVALAVKAAKYYHGFAFI